jgi:predicted amidohydrolase YtcJ
MAGLLQIRNARVWTGDPRRPWLGSLFIGAGRVVAAEEAAGLARRVRGADERVIDARGRVVTPGLIDSHVHLLMGGQSLGEVDLSGVRSREQFERTIAEAHARLPAGQWLIGRGWSEQNWPGHAMPDKTWLKACRVGTAHRERQHVNGAVGDAHPTAGNAARPCVCHRMDIHAALVNEPVLEMIGAATRSDPAGGRIVRDLATREPTGFLLESAAWDLVHPLIPQPDLASKRAALRIAQAHAHALGLTGVGSMESAADVEQVFRPLRDDLSLRCAITLLDRATGGEPFDFEFGQRFDNDHRLSVIGYKTFIDGTLGSRTARLLSEYADRGGDRGLLVELAARGRLNEWAAAVVRAGLSPSMHAIGDEAVRLALDAAAAAESAGAKASNGMRPRIEHAQHVDASDVPRFRDRIASMQPLHKADDGRIIEQRLGRERSRGAFAFRSLRDAGAMLAFGSDWPVVSCDPLLGMRSAITGLTVDDQPFNVQENLTPEEALIAYTVDAALTLNMRDAGMLRVGALADCVMFDIDPFTADWIRRPPRVILTIVGGEAVFDATQEQVHAHAR